MALLPLIMAGCQTTNKIVLPPTPERQQIEVPKNYKEAAFTINYYEHLVQQWETWAESVKKLTDNKQ